MPLIDSPESRYNQMPSTAAKPKPKKKVVARKRTKTTTPKKVVSRKRAVVSRSRTRSESNNNYEQPRRRRRSSSSNTRTRRSTTPARSYERAAPKRVAPKPPPAPTAKIVKPAAPPKPPPPPSVDKYLAGDSTYQRQLAAFNKALADYQAEQGLSRQDYQTTFDQNYRDIGVSKTEALDNLEEDFASRGLLKSGLYTADLGELNKQYQNQYTDLQSQRTGFLDQLVQDLTKYKNEQGVQKGNAYAEAVRRRAEKYNL